MISALPRGYCTYPGVLGAEDIAGLRDAVTETVDRTARALRTPFEMSCPESPFDARLERVAQQDLAYASALFHAVMADAHRDVRVRNLAQHPRLDDLVRHLVAPKRIVGQVIRPRAVLPALSRARSPWHQDVVRPSTTAESCGSVQVACWIPLCDAGADTGALEVIPELLDKPLPHQISDSGHFFVREDDLPSAVPETVEVRAGDVLVLDRFVLHRSRPVRAGFVRWAMVMWVKGAAAQAAGR